MLVGLVPLSGVFVKASKAGMWVSCTVLTDSYGTCGLDLGSSGPRPSTLMLMRKRWLVRTWTHMGKTMYFKNIDV